MPFNGEVGQVSVKITEGRGLNAEEVADMATNKIVQISVVHGDPIVLAQAEAYKKHVAKVIEHYIKMALRSDRTTVFHAIKDAGHPELAELIRRM
jgi:hypothetical protein